jgi:hypothetical protein
VEKIAVAVADQKAGKCVDEAIPSRPRAHRARTLRIQTARAVVKIAVAVADQKAGKRVDEAILGRPRVHRARTLRIQTALSEIQSRRDAPLCRQQRTWEDASRTSPSDSKH